MRKSLIALKLKSAISYHYQSLSFLKFTFALLYNEKTEDLIDEKLQYVL